MSQQRSRQPWWGPALAGIVVAALSLPSPLTGQPAGAADSLLSESEARRQAATSERVAPHLQRARPQGAVLAHVRGTEGFVPSSWVVYLETGEGEPAGLVGIDPETGSFQFANHLRSDYEYPTFDAERLRAGLQRRDIDPSRYEWEGARFVFFGGRVKGNFWVVPHASGDLAQSLAVSAYHRRLKPHLGVDPLVEPEGGGLVYRLGDGFLEAARRNITEEPASSDSVFSLVSDTARASSSPGGGADGEANRTRRSAGPSRPPEAFADDLGAAQAAGHDTTLIDDVPVYSQDNTNLCGKYVLAMVHQWWSPIDLGTGENQVNEIMSYLNHSHEWTLPPAVEKVMNHWNQVDGSYQDFQTTWSGEAPQIHTGAPTGKSDDMKSWIYYLDAPVAVLGNATGNSPFGLSVDHWVVVTGYDDATKTLYYNNSGAWIGSCSGCSRRATVSYSTWNNDFIPHNRAQMVAGYPGDQDHANASAGRWISAGRIEDDERVHLFPIELEALWDDAAEGSVSFGRSLESTVTLTVDGGWFENPSRGGFDGASVASSRRRAVFTHTSGLSQGDSPAAAELYLDPIKPGTSGGTGLGSDTVTVRRIVHDEDDRTHGSPALTLSKIDYTYGSNNNVQSRSTTTMSMPPGVLQPDTSVNHVTFYVEDDDTNGPHFANRRPASQSSTSDANWPSGGFPVRADVTDRSGLQEVRFHYEIEDLPSGRSVATGSDTVATHGSGTYRYDIPRRDWFDHDKVTWWVEATDDDSDRPNDRASSTSIKFAFYLTDDDTTGPTVKAARDTFTTVTRGSRKIRRYTLKVRLNDPSGVVDDSVFPRVYHRQKPGLAPQRTPTINDTVRDGSVKMNRSGSWYEATVADTVRTQGGVFSTLYWRVKAQDDDQDRPNDRAVGWSDVYSADRARPAGKLCVSPAPPSHDFGTISPSGSTYRQWSFTVKNCGGERAKSIKVFKRLPQSLQQPVTGRRPSCPHGASNCWLSVGGISSRGETLLGGDSVQVPVEIDTGGLDYQVSPLPPGQYEAVIRILKGQKSVRGTIRVAVPDSTGDVPQPEAGDEDDETTDLTEPIPRDPTPWGGVCHLGVEAGVERTDLATPGSRFETDAQTSPLAGVVLRCDPIDPLGFRIGGYYVERGGTLTRDLATTVDATYLDVPLLLTAAIPTGSAIRPRLYLGPAAGIELSCDASATLDGDEFFSGECGPGADLPVELEAPSVDWGLLFGGGLDIRAGPGALTLSARYRTGLSAVGRVGSEDDGAIENRGLGFLAGYLFAIP